MDAMTVIYQLLDGMDSTLIRHLIAANAVLGTGYLVWCLFGARTELGDWDSASLKHLPLWVIGLNIAMIVTLG